VNAVAVDLAAEVENLTSLGMEDDVTAFDGALDAAGLMRALEMT